MPHRHFKPMSNKWTKKEQCTDKNIKRMSHSSCANNTWYFQYHDIRFEYVKLGRNFSICISTIIISGINSDLKQISSMDHTKIIAHSEMPYQIGKFLNNRPWQKMYYNGKNIRNESLDRSNGNGININERKKPHGPTTSHMPHKILIYSWWHAMFPVVNSKFNTRT